MKIELVDICTGLAGFIAPATLVKDVSGISQFTSLVVVSFICAYGSISMMRSITGDKK